MLFRFYQAILDVLGFGTKFSRVKLNFLKFLEKFVLEIKIFSNKIPVTFLIKLHVGNSCGARELSDLYSYNGLTYACVYIFYRVTVIY